MRLLVIIYGYLSLSKGTLGCFADNSYFRTQGLNGCARRRSRSRATSADVRVSRDCLPLYPNLNDLSPLARKLKCDGGRPACSQCYKRSNPCDYTASQKGRGGRKARKQFGGSESEGESLEDQSMDLENASQSPEVSVASHPQSQPTSRRNSNVSMLLGETLPSLSSAIERRDESVNSTTLPPIQQATTSLRNVTLTDARPELPPITTLSAPPASASKSLPQEDPPSIGSLKSEDSQMTGRRRTSAAAATGKARASNHGSKIVACNVCRGAC